MSRRRRGGRAARWGPNRILTVAVLGFLAVVWTAAHWTEIEEMTRHG